MSVVLLKGQKLSLNKDNPDLKKFSVTIEWKLDKEPTENILFDLDISAFLLTASGKVEDPKDFVFYGNLKHPSGSVILNDNIKRIGDSQSITVKLDLSLVPSSIMRISFTATIYEAEVRRQSFSKISEAAISIKDDFSNKEILRYQLAERYNVETAVVFGEIYRNNKEWKFNTIGGGFTGGLAALCRNYGVEVD